MRSRRSAAAAPAGAPDAKPRSPRSFSIPPRAVALLVIFALLAFSYASSLRVFLVQQRALSVAQQQLADRQAAVDRLNDELTRWADPNYVKAQARERLGWVVPGDTAYQVIDVDGNRLGADLTAAVGVAQDGDEAWWDRLWGSVQAADLPEPEPKPTQPAAIQTIRASTTPTAR